MFRITTIILCVILLCILLIVHFLTRPVFQHSRVPISETAYKLVTSVRRDLLKGVIDVLEQRNIRYVVSDGNLLEITRGTRIVQDDDIDIRIHKHDLDVWLDYCLESEVDLDRNLDLSDHRRLRIDEQRKNGIQISLLKYGNDEKSIENMKVHVDVVSSDIETETWINYEDAFSEPLRRVEYLGTMVWIPSMNKAHELLAKTYGTNYMVPVPNFTFDFDPEKY